MLAALQQRFDTWALRRQRYDSGTVTLNQRSIYILPTRQGFAFGFVLVLMLLGDINYNLSLGYVLTFLLATMGGMSMLHAFRNMAQLQVRAGHVEPVFAGDSARFVFHVHNASKLQRHCIILHDAHGHSTSFGVAAFGHTEAELGIPAPQRGWLNPGRLTLYTHFPLGLFHAWSYLHFDVRGLVYPRPAARLPLPAASADDGSGKQAVAGDEDFAGLRGYVAGDALQRIAWKALAREQGLQVKQFNAQQGRELWLDWSQLPAIADERKLELLTRWVLDAEGQGLRYGLSLPGIELPPGHGPSHRTECLRALALFGLGEAAA
ncbi:hypothetical protein MIZ01_1975 [Sideroxyarcus emersonii]|uniref:DUF58 domain-containing protein n=1 Tax=Sideroxyarcus emersonii TaxID=2764705 RepID=A0AAN1XBC5_9PROT|nr:DUF58 domain-containing protein [Sideroxyarcus emersonii]BCK88174.1 hypothetical protein MIZ01_1975 [Sideroxyarcus emersonii]